MKQGKTSTWLGLFLSFLLMGCNHLLYPADRFPYMIPDQIKPKPQELKIDVSSSEQLHAWYWPSQTKEKKGIVVHFHGNGQNLTTHFMFLKWVIDFGYDYMIFDYRGYGASSGEKANQEQTVQDGLAVLQYIHKQYPSLPVIAAGQSLGSAVLGRTLQEITASGRKELLPQFVVFDSSFISYQAAARSVLKQKWLLYPFLPFTYLVISDDWSPQNRLQDQPSSIPAMFFHNTGDMIIRIDLGNQAFEAWKGPKLFVRDEDGAHTSAFGDPKFLNRRKQLLDCFEHVIGQGKSIENCPT